MFELRLTCPEDRVEPITDALDALDALSVSVEDADADTDAERALFGEPGMPPPAQSWSRTRVVALFPAEAPAQEAARLLALQDFFDGCTVQAVAAVPDQDWVRLTQSQFEPVDITPTFWIVPSWHEAPAEARQIMRLDPGLAFGTGTHPTTRMCLRWIAHHAAELGHVLDYGCGSGILAIAAAKFGGGPVVGVDIDPDAVTATKANASANDVTLQADLPDSLRDARFDIVVANILSAPLKLLAPAIAAHVSPGGWLVLSGILDRQAEELIAAYSPYATLQIDKTLDGWVCLAGRTHR